MLAHVFTGHPQACRLTHTSLPDTTTETTWKGKKLPSGPGRVQKQLHELHRKNGVPKAEWKGRATFCRSYGITDGIVYNSMSSHSYIHLVREGQQTERGRAANIPDETGQA